MASTIGNDELYPLWKLYTALGNSAVCFYDSNTSYACGGSWQDIPAREVLEIRRDHPEECVRIGYVGEDASLMKETMRGLGLPQSLSASDDEVTRVFCRFRDDLSRYNSDVQVF